MDALHDLIFGSGTAIKQCQSVDHNNNITLLIGRNSGGTDPAETAVESAKPSSSVASYDVAGLISTFGVTTGALVTSGTVTVPWNRRSAGSTFAGDSSHFTMSGANATGYTTTFSASQGQAATGNAEIMFFSTDGKASPLSTATGATLSANAFNAQYTLGPATIDGTEVTQITAATVNTGINMRSELYSGGVYPIQDNCVIETRDPVIELTFANFDQIDTYGPLFITNDSKDVVVYFRKLADGSTRVSDATGAHIAFTLSDGIITIENFSGQDTQDGSVTMRITGKSLAASATSAIS